MISNQSECPHNRAVKSLSMKTDLINDFLSKHIETCPSCNNTAKKFKFDHKRLKEGIPYFTASEEVKTLFKQESEEFGNKILKRKKIINKKRREASKKELFVVLNDLKISFKSPAFVLTCLSVLTVWMYYSLINV